MDEKSIDEIVNKIMKEFDEKQLLIPIFVSARHCHISKEHLNILFGEEAILTEKSKLRQPGEYAAHEKVIIVGPKGAISDVRILGPTRSHTQVEVSQSDAVKLGVSPPIRMSGKIEGSSPITMVGPKGSIYLQEGLIIAQSHIHMSERDAKEFNVSNEEKVQVEVDSPRPLTFSQVVVRVSNKYILEMHIDTDEANAAYIGNDHKGKLIKRNELYD